MALIIISLGDAEGASMFSIFFFPAMYVGLYYIEISPL